MTIDRLGEVRSILAEMKVSGFIQPHEDEFLNEFVPPHAERLAWLTGFTGSAGTAVVLAEKAALFVDGRYTLQAAEQVDTARFTVERHDRVSRWIQDNLAAGKSLGYDPRLVSFSGAKALRTAVGKAQGTLQALDENPIDRCWNDRPTPPTGKIFPYPLEETGKESSEKRADLTACLREEKTDAVVICATDSLTWLLNIRGSDLPYSPIPLARAVLSSDGSVALFVEAIKTDSDVLLHLGEKVSIRDPDTLPEILREFGTRNATVRIDPLTTPSWIPEELEKAGAQVREGSDPIALAKAIKNPVELEGMRRVHRTDGRAVVRFLHWLDENAPSNTITECSAADKLEAFRREDSSFQGLSFPTISGAGPNGAIVHYRAEPGNDLALTAGTLYLVDSGGQYPGGTTDITRTIALGETDEEMHDRFTRVLRGHIALARARFPRGTTGGQLDALARAPLWEAGLTYEHGTGHGVGSFLNVHEGPQSIGFRVSPGPKRQAAPSTLVALKPGMVISNEPGYYRAERYGIRIENLVAVTKQPRPAGGEIETLGFETLTLAPIDRRLIVSPMLAPSEREWLDTYHQRVFETLGEGLDPATRNWLKVACAPLQS